MSLIRDKIAICAIHVGQCVFAEVTEEGYFRSPVKGNTLNFSVKCNGDSFVKNVF